MENENKKIVWPFWAQLPTLCFVGIILYWALLPYEADPCLTAASNAGFIVCFFGCIPLGIAGAVLSKKKAGRMDRLRIPAKILSIINIVLGSIEVFVGLYLIMDIVQGILYR